MACPVRDACRPPLVGIQPADGPLLPGESGNGRAVRGAAQPGGFDSARVELGGGVGAGHCVAACRCQPGRCARAAPVGLTGAAAAGE